MKILTICLLMATVLNVTARKHKDSRNYITNPILPGYFADPSIIVHNDTFYLYATIDPWGGDSLALFISADFKSWQRRPLNWPTKVLCKSPTSNESRVWAPSVVKGIDNKFHMFVSVGSEVYAGISNHPEGPWKNVHADGSVFVSTQKAINVHTIDAEAFLDDDGKAYLYWGSGWGWKDGHCFVAQLNDAMDAFVTTPKDITPPNYFEGPYMVKRKGIYYLMYSHGKCTDSTYNVRCSTAKNPIGPWTEGENNPVLSSDMANNIIGPGHHAMLHFKGRDYIIYHRIADNKNKDLLREICIDEIKIKKDGNMDVVKPTQTGLKNFVSAKR